MKTNIFNAYVLNNSKEIAIQAGKSHPATITLTHTTPICTTIEVVLQDQKKNKYIRRKTIARTTHWVATIKDENILITSKKMTNQHDIVSIAKQRDLLMQELELLFAQIIETQTTQPTKITAA